METEKIVYAIQNKEGLFATYGRSEFHKDLRFARLYKSKKTALKHYFNNKGEYKNLTFALMTYFPFAYLIRIGVYRSREMLFFAFLSFISCLICFWVKQSLAMETMFWTENVTNNAGYMLATVLPLLGILMGLGKRKYFYIALVVSVILVSFSVKRGAIVCLIIILFCFWYSFFYMSKSENRQLAFRNLLGALIVLGLLVLGVYYVASTNKYLLLRMQDMLEGNSSGRDVLAESLIKAYDNFLIEEQLFGKGLLQSIHISGNYAHSDWLELLIDGGILGLFVYILLFKNIMFYYIENRIVMSSACKFIVLSVLLSWFAKSIFSMGFFVPESCLYLVAISCTSYLSELNKE